MEIKQGDKVRVSRDIPQFYLEYNSYRMFEIEHRVVDVNMEDGFALLDSIPPKFTTILPIMYLVKVDAEAEEPKIKLGDMVRVKGNLHEPFCLDADLHLEITNMPPHAVSQKEWKVIKVENRRDCAGHIYTLNRDDSFIHNIPEDCVELVKPTEQAEAKEAARIRQMEVELDEFRKEEIDRVLHPEKYYTYEVTIDNVAMNWQRYEADLAKELAIAYGKRGKSPLDAVAAAKEITKRLKQK